MFYNPNLVSAIADEDELKTGVRREGNFYGVNALVVRLSTIFIFLTINMVFQSVGWTVFTPETAGPDTIFGLRLLIFVFPVIALGVGIVAMYFFPITKSRFEEIKTEVNELHEKKSANLQSI